AASAGGVRRRSMLKRRPGARQVLGPRRGGKLFIPVQAQTLREGLHMGVRGHATIAGLVHALGVYRRRYSNPRCERQKLLDVVLLPEERCAYPRLSSLLPQTC